MSATFTKVGVALQSNNPRRDDVRARSDDKWKLQHVLQHLESDDTDDRKVPAGTVVERFFVYEGNPIQPVGRLHPESHALCCALCSESPTVNHTQPYAICKILGSSNRHLVPLNQLHFQRNFSTFRGKGRKKRVGCYNSATELSTCSVTKLKTAPSTMLLWQNIPKCCSAATLCRPTSVKLPQLLRFRCCCSCSVASVMLLHQENEVFKMAYHSTGRRWCRRVGSGHLAQRRRRARCTRRAAQERQGPRTATWSNASSVIYAVEARVRSDDCRAR
jgi:hypothetical protein